MKASTVEIVVVGSGAAALGAALTAAVGGAEVLVLEKSESLGGTSAMSGGAVWVPCNHVARAHGLSDSPEEALDYLHATAPEGWAETEAPLWERFVHAAPRMLELVDAHTPLELEISGEPDPMAEHRGGKLNGRTVSPRPLRRSVAGAFRSRLRPSTLPNLFTYREILEHGPYQHPVRAVLALLPKLVHRLLTGARGQGHALIAGLVRGCLDHGCNIELGTRVVELVTDETGAVVGVTVERPGGREQIQARRGVVIATGGFEWDDALREQHFPGPLDRIGSPRTNTGDGQRMAARAGAALAHMDQANVYATLPTRYEGRIHGMPTLFHAAPHAIVVNRHGQRFASEIDYNFGEFLDAREEGTGDPVHLPCWMIADAQFLARSGMFRWYARKLPGWMRRAPSVASLAALIGVPAAALVETVERFNRFAAAGRDEDFHRGESTWERFKSPATEGNPGPALGAITRAPFVAVPVNRSILVTKGGPRTNADGQVLRPDGSVIGGLYCAGVAMANPIGTRAVGAGTTLGPCLTWGYICGQSLLRSNR
ncbi:MAG: FAD-binding protein [Ectothiorhodospiraceae bacterium]|nr:FAD-binding protein [Ectothiorhodospiraceae bacterium]